MDICEENTALQGSGGGQGAHLHRVRSFVQPWSSLTGDAAGTGPLAPSTVVQPRPNWRGWFGAAGGEGELLSCFRMFPHTKDPTACPKVRQAQLGHVALAGSAWPVKGGRPEPLACP